MREATVKAMVLIGPKVGSTARTHRDEGPPRANGEPWTFARALRDGAIAGRAGDGGAAAPLCAHADGRGARHSHQHHDLPRPPRPALGRRGASSAVTMAHVGPVLIDRGCRTLGVFFHFAATQAGADSGLYAGHARPLPAGTAGRPAGLARWDRAHGPAAPVGSQLIPCKLAGLGRSKRCGSHQGPVHGGGRHAKGHPLGQHATDRSGYLGARAGLQNH